MKVIIILLITVFFLYKKIKSSRVAESGNSSESDTFDPMYFEAEEQNIEDVRVDYDSLTENERRITINDEEIKASEPEKEKEFSLRDAIIYSAILDRPYK